MRQWSFEADYFTACNCDWGCPCNFNARPTEGRCMGWGAWNVITGQCGATSLDGTRFALYYKFPGSVEQGQGTACAYASKRGRGSLYPQKCANFSSLGRMPASDLAFEGMCPLSALQNHRMPAGWRAWIFARAYRNAASKW